MSSCDFVLSPSPPDTSYPVALLLTHPLKLFCCFLQFLQTPFILLLQLLHLENNKIKVTETNKKKKTGSDESALSNAAELDFVFDSHDPHNSSQAVNKNVLIRFVSDGADVCWFVLLDSCTSQREDH